MKTFLFLERKGSQTVNTLDKVVCFFNAARQDFLLACGGNLEWGVVSPQELVSRIKFRVFRPLKHWKGTLH